MDWWVDKLVAMFINLFAIKIFENFAFPLHFKVSVRILKHWYISCNLQNDKKGSLIIVRVPTTTPKRAQLKVFKFLVFLSTFFLGSIGIFGSSWWQYVWFTI